MDNLITKAEQRCDLKARVIYPPLKGKTWEDVAGNPNISVMIVDDVSRAYALCAAGTPALAVTGISKDILERKLMNLGASILSSLEALVNG